MRGALLLPVTTQSTPKTTLRVAPNALMVVVEEAAVAGVVKVEGGGGHPTEYTPNKVRVGDRDADEAGEGVSVRAGNDAAEAAAVGLLLAFNPPPSARKGVQMHVRDDTLGRIGEMGRMTGFTATTSDPPAPPTPV